MANTISSGLLRDTYQIVQLARESALAQGKQTEAEKLSPIVDNLKTLVHSTKETGAATASGPINSTVKENVPPTGMMAQSDFQTLLNAAKSVPAAGKTASENHVAERNQMVRSMAAGNMMDVDIARKMGMTREEVRLILSVGTK